MASSRGFFIGQIVDELAAIANQVAVRARLGDSALSGMLENFFRDVLNLVYGWQLENLNSTRSNEPGLDLGDAVAKVAFQVTSTASSAKVNSTIEKVSTAHLARYDKIRVFVIGEKQTTYTLNEANAARVKFSDEDIWDMNDVLRSAIMLQALRLQDLHKLIMAETVRIRVELEVKNADGKYPTTIEDFIEAKGSVLLTDASTFITSDFAGLEYGDDVEKAAEHLNSFAAALSELPRLSREFLAVMLSRKESRRGIGASGFHVNADLVDKISRYPDTQSELRFLQDRGFIEFDGPEFEGVSPYWRFRFPGTKSDFAEAFFDFLSSADIKLKAPIVDLDFSGFGTAT